MMSEASIVQSHYYSLQLTTGITTAVKYIFLTERWMQLKCLLMSLNPSCVYQKGLLDPKGMEQDSVQVCLLMSGLCTSTIPKCRREQPRIC